MNNTDIIIEQIMNTSSFREALDYIMHPTVCINNKLTKIEQLFCFQIAKLKFIREGEIYED